MENNKIYPLNIQQFAEGEGEPAPNEKQENQTAKTFTQEDVNAIVSRESKAAVEKLLKEVGIAPEGDYKSVLKAFREWQDSQKTELEKTTGALTAAEKAKAEAEAKANALEKQLTALSKGIPQDKVEKYAKLAEAYMNEKTDFATALDLALKDFPVVEKGAPGAGGNPPPVENKKTPLPKGTVIF